MRGPIHRNRTGWCRWSNAAMGGARSQAQLKLLALRFVPRSWAGHAAESPFERSEHSGSIVGRDLGRGRFKTDLARASSRPTKGLFGQALRGAVGALGAMHSKGENGESGPGPPLATAIYRRSS